MPEATVDADRFTVPRQDNIRTARGGPFGADGNLYPILCTMRLTIISGCVFLPRILDMTRLRSAEGRWSTVSVLYEPRQLRVTLAYGGPPVSAREWLKRRSSLTFRVEFTLGDAPGS